MTSSVENSTVEHTTRTGHPGRKPDASVVLRVSGASVRSGPATWGQLHMLRHLANAGANAQIFSQGDVIPVPDGCDLDRLLNALRVTLERYETLRTTCHRDGDEARQSVTGAGELAIGLYEAPVEQVPDAVRQVIADLTAAAFTPESGWPVRFGVVQTARRPVMLVVAYNHLALDAGGGQVVLADLMPLMAGEEPGPPPAWQPVDQARFEQSPEGQAVNDRSLEYLRQILRSAPASMFDFPAPQPLGDPAERAAMIELWSPAAAAASDTLAARLDVSSPSVMLAAVAVVLGLYSGRTVSVVQLVAANRTSEPQRSLAANVALDGICLVDFTGLSFEQTIRRAFEASVSTYLNGQAHPGLRWATIRKQERELGRHICLNAVFNHGREPSSTEDSDPGEPLESLMRRSKVIGQRRPHISRRFYVSIGGRGANRQFAFFGNTWYLPYDTMMEMLYGFERLLVTAAARDIPAVDVPTVAGVRPVRRGPDWVRCRDGYVDLVATRELWRTVAGTDVADVYPVPMDGGLHRLVGYVYAPADDRTVAGLHRDFMDAVGESTSVRAPDWYVRCQEAPVSRSDREGWSTRPVVEEGRGR